MHCLFSHKTVKKNNKIFNSFFAYKSLNHLNNTGVSGDFFHIFVCLFVLFGKGKTFIGVMGAVAKDAYVCEPMVERKNLLNVSIFNKFTRIHFHIRITFGTYFRFFSSIELRML